MKYISTEKAPAAIGPYSQAIVTGNLLFTSGQIPIDPATGNIVEGGIAEQAEQIMKNVKRVNVGRSEIKPRWATTVKHVNAYLESKTVSADQTGLDKNGRLLRR